MGTLRSASDCSGMTINGVLLGEPAFSDVENPDAEPLFIWDHSFLPTGMILDDGTIQIDEEDGNHAI